MTFEKALLNHVHVVQNNSRKRRAARVYHGSSYRPVSRAKSAGSARCIVHTRAYTLTYISYFSFLDHGSRWLHRERTGSTLSLQARFLIVEIVLRHRNTAGWYLMARRGTLWWIFTWRSFRCCCCCCRCFLDSACFRQRFSSLMLIWQVAWL